VRGDASWKKMSDDTHRLGPREPSLSDAPTGQLRAPGGLVVEAGGRTDKGRVRTGNEDAFGFEPPTSSLARARGMLLIVSDGMGGHAAGEVASHLAVETIQATYYREHGASTADAIQSAIVAANDAIHENAERDAAHSGMGCTVVAMVVQGNSLTVGHVGDSRGYLIRGGRARQLTRDHSWVAMQVEEGILTPAQAKHHPNRSLLMRALGRQPSVEVELGQHQLQAGDVLLLCSDGLTGVVNDDEIGDYASRYGPQTVADQLVNLANQRGAPDNVTVLAAAITAGPGPAGAVNSAATTVVVPAGEVVTAELTPPPVDATTIPLPRSAAASAGPPAGTPVVLSRESSLPRVADAGRRRRGRWLAGSLAAFGLAAGLVLLTLLGPSPAGSPEPARVAEAPASQKPVATPPAPGQPTTAASVPPPVATGLPGMTAPAPAVAAAPPPPAAATPTPGAGSNPGATAIAAIAGNPVTTPLVPAIAAILATPTGPAGSPPALTGPTATPTPVESGADAPSPADAAADQPSDAGADQPSDAGADVPGPEAGDPSTTEDGGPVGEDAPAEPPAAETAPGASGEAGQEQSQPPRLSPGSGVTLPGSLPFRPSRKPSDD
jgi:protein phosphatase